ncbi:MAG: hypothetical protein R3E12_07440 [Candidatus Eisenbacteria bacterium]
MSIVLMEHEATTSSSLRTGVALAWALALALSAAAPTAGRADDGMQEYFIRPTGVSAAAATKIEPRLLLAMAMPRQDEGILARMGQRIPMMGRAADDITFPVVIQSTLSDAELADLGAKPDSRVGNLVTARVAEFDLGRLASDPHVQAIEAAYWLASTLDVSIPEIRANLVNDPGNGGVSGKGVLFGLIDDGLDLTHGDFKDGQALPSVQFVGSLRDRHSAGGLQLWPASTPRLRSMRVRPTSSRTRAATDRM